MFNNSKSQEFFNPSEFETPINIIGCGAIGARVAETLARLGIRRLIIWDPDTVAEHNLGNQAYNRQDIGRKKTEALLEDLRGINPEIRIVTREVCTTADKLVGSVFCCIDNIDDRRALTESWIKQPDIDFVTDIRMRMIDGVIYSADWFSNKEKANLLESMNYTHEEALKETPLSACGSTLSVVYAPIILANFAVSNYINFVRANTYKRFIQINTQSMFIDSYDAM